MSIDVVAAHRRLGGLLRDTIRHDHALRERSRPKPFADEFGVKPPRPWPRSLTMPGHCWPDVHDARPDRRPRWRHLDLGVWWVELAMVVFPRLACGAGQRFANERAARFFDRADAEDDLWRFRSPLE